jgi:hypothetical protein
MTFSMNENGLSFFSFSHIEHSTLIQHWRGLGGSTKHIWPIRAYRLAHLIVYELNLAYIFLIGFYLLSMVG